MPVHHALVRLEASGKKALSRAQKTFNRLAQAIEQQRRRLAEWQAFAQGFGSRVASELTPLERRLDEQRRALLKRLDAAHDSGALTRREQTRVGQIICQRTGEMLAARRDRIDGDSGMGGPVGDDAGRDDAELIALHDKYSDVSHEDLREAELAALRAMAEATLGMSFDDGEIRTPEAIFDAVSRRFEEATGQDVGRQDVGRQDDDEPASADRRDGSAEAGGPKPRSARASGRLERERAAVAGATRSVREVYRKLASALHPDRERDPAERVRKTALMQRVNQAYEAKDLLRLMALQIEVEQIDPDHLATIADDQLAHYNRVLKEQSAALDLAIQELAEPFAAGLGGRGHRELTPAIIVGRFQQDLANLRRESAWMAEQLDLLKDVRMLKAWLKAQRIERGPSIDPLESLESLMATMADEVDIPAGPKGGRGGRRRTRRQRFE